MDPNERIRYLESLLKTVVSVQTKSAPDLKSKFQARVRHDPPLSNAETTTAWDLLPKGRKITSRQYAELVPGPNFDTRFALACRYLYWLCQKGIIKWDKPTRGYIVPTCGSF